MIRTSITGKPSEKGFTLIELLVVIAIIGLVLYLAVPTTRDALTVSNIKKASRQLIGLERQLRVDAVRDQVDYILLLEIPGSSYWVMTPDMTPEKQAEVKKNAKKFPSGVTVLDIINHKNEKIVDGEVKIRFGKNKICTPMVIHLAEDEERMTLVVNPFLGVTAIHDKYVEISPEDGLGKDTVK